MIPYFVVIMKLHFFVFGSRLGFFYMYELFRRDVGRLGFLLHVRVRERIYIHESDLDNHPLKTTRCFFFKKLLDMSSDVIGYLFILSGCGMVGKICGGKKKIYRVESIVELFSTR
jgi:hypothetical protein